jgi:ketosteroid isomerase-like protein
VAGQGDAAIVRRAYEALNDGDMEAALAPLDERAEWHEISLLPEAGAYVGRDAIVSLLATFLESWEEVRQDIEDTVVAGDRVGLFIHLRARGRGSGVEVDRRYAHVWTMRDGRGVRVDAYDEPGAAREALGRVADTPQAPANTTVTRKSE